MGISLTSALPFCTKPAKDSLAEFLEYDPDNQSNLLNFNLSFCNFFKVVNCSTALLAAIFLKNMSDVV